jgi:hypothetical protein
MLRLIHLYKDLSFQDISYIRKPKVRGKYHIHCTGADRGFQVRGAHLKTLRRSEGGAKIFGVFRVKNHIFSNFREGGRRAGCAPPWIRTCCSLSFQMSLWNVISTSRESKIKSKGFPIFCLNLVSIQIYNKKNHIHHVMFNINL